MTSIFVYFLSAFTKLCFKVFNTNYIIIEVTFSVLGVYFFDVLYLYVFNKLLFEY